MEEIQKVSLDNEIEQLKLENQLLRKKLDATQVASQMDKPTSLVEYYVRKYLDSHNDILRSRLSSIETGLAKAKENLDKMQNKETLAIFAQESKDNASQRIRQYDDKIETNLLNLENMNFELEQVNSNYEKAVVTFQEYQSGYYENIVEAIKVNKPNQEIMEYVDFVMKQLYTQLEDLYQTLSQKKQVKIALEKKKIAYSQQILKENATYQMEKNKLSQALQDLKKGSNDIIVSQSKNTYQQCLNQKQELVDLFDNLKQENLRKIVDEIHHAQILSMPQDKIVSHMDELVSEEALNLQKVTTKSSQLVHLQQKKNECLSKKIQGDTEKEEYEYLQKVFDYLEKTDKQVEENITKIETFVHQVNHLIQNNPTYQSFFQQYEEDEEKHSDLEEELSLKKGRLAFLLNNPPTEPIEKVDQTVDALQQEICELTKKYKELEDSLEQRKENKNFYDFVVVCLEKNLCEKRLPILYQKQRKLSTLLESRRNQLMTSKEKLKDYETTLSELEEIENEIKNCR